MSLPLIPLHYGTAKLFRGPCTANMPVLCLAGIPLLCACPPLTSLLVHVFQQRNFSPPNLNDSLPAPLICRSRQVGQYLSCQASLLKTPSWRYSQAVKFKRNLLVKRGFKKRFVAQTRQRVSSNESWLGGPPFSISSCVTLVILPVPLAPELPT